jgi:hypothetical protein
VGRGLVAGTEILEVSGGVINGAMGFCVGSTCILTGKAVGWLVGVKPRERKAPHSMVALFPDELRVFFHRCRLVLACLID